MLVYFLHAPRGPFYNPRQLGAIGGNQGRQFLPSFGWRIGQSGVPPGRHCSVSGADCLPKMAQPTVEDLEPLAHQTLSGVHQTVRCPHLIVGSATRHARIARPTVGSADRWLTGQSGEPPDSPVNHRTVRCPHLIVGSATRHARIARPTVGSADRWLTGQSGEPPDSPVIFSRTPPTNSRERPVDQEPAWRTGHCPVHHRIVRCTQTTLSLGCFSQVLFFFYFL
jgi:hypothetical protein